MLSITRADLIQKIAEEHHISRTKAEMAVDAIFEGISEALIQGGRVEIRGFGSFSSRTYKPRKGRNPRTGEPIEVEEKRLPFFKVGKKLREQLNQPEE